jgi:hypothetical protein
MFLLEGYTYIFQILRALVEFSDFLCQPISRWTNYTTKYIDIEVQQTTDTVDAFQGAHRVKFFRILLPLLILLHHLPQ